MVWNPHYIVHISKIESLQKQFLLFALRNLRWEQDRKLPSYNSRLKLIDLPSLVNRRIMLSVTFLQKLINGEINSPFLLNKLYFNVPTRTRYFAPLRLDRCLTNFAANQPFQVLCQHYNNYYVHFVHTNSVYCIRRILLSALSK